MKLHLLWDELPGQYKSEEICADLAAALRADPRYSRTALKDSLAITDFAAWANYAQVLDQGSPGSSLASLRQEVEALRAERKQVRARIEKLLAQIDPVSGQ